MKHLMVLLALVIYYHPLLAQEEDDTTPQETEEIATPPETETGDDGKEAKESAEGTSEKEKSNFVKLSLGASFDFFEGSSATNLYYDVNFFLPSVWDKENPFLHRIGLEFNYYQMSLIGNSTFTNDSLSIELTMAPLEYDRNTEDDIVYAETYDLQYNSASSFRNIGLYVAPTIRLVEGFHLVTQWESYFQEEKRTVQYQIINRDSVQLSINQYGSGPSESQLRLREIENGQRDERLSYTMYTFVGAGVLLNLNHGPINFRFKPTIGYAWEQRIPVYSDPTSQWYYGIDLHIVETKTGLKLGGRIRNFINDNEPTSVGIWLSKQGSLSDLAKFITKG